MFSDGDFITTEAISIEAGDLVFDIEPGIYVPGNIEELALSLMAAVEKVSGLDFDGAGKGFCQSNFEDGKIHIRVTRDIIDIPENDPMKKSEVATAYAAEDEHVVIPPGDLLLGNSYAISHELGHMLNYRHTQWGHCRMLQEGFAEYTAYLTLKELEECDPVTAYYLEPSTYSLYCMVIDNYDLLYKYPIEYWFENEFSGSGNGLYSVGLRFMAYLHEVYGDYTKWMTEFESVHKTYSPFNSEVKDQIQIFKKVYGDDVLDNFYPWLQEHQDMFGGHEIGRVYTDRTALESINLYPEYNAIEYVARLDSVKYKDLYINLETTRKYINEYKQDDASDIYLVTRNELKLGLYQADGSYTFVTTMPMEPVPLDGISYFKLIGEGEVERLEIRGSFYTHLM